MASSLTLSNSEPNLLRNNTTPDDDDVIGFSENISGVNRNNDSNRTNNNEDTIKRETNSPMSFDDVSHDETPRQPATDVVDFPSLPGTKSYVVPTTTVARVEEFPALAPSVRPKAQHRTRVSKSSSLTTHSSAVTSSSIVNTGSKNKTDILGHVNGIQVTKAKTRKKGKTKQAKISDNLSNSSIDGVAFPTLGSSSSAPALAVVEKQNIGTSSVKNSKPEIKTENQQEIATKRNGTTRPAPGFQQVKVNGKVSKPPPGLASKQDYPEMPRAPPPGLDNKKPSGGDTAQRNIRLMAMLQTHLDDFNLNVFKDVSGKFRREIITARQYYETISALLGDNLKYVFSELVDLLPEEKKRQELLVLRNDQKVKVKQEKQRLATVPDYTQPKRWGADSDQRNSAPTPKEESESRCDQCGVTMKTSEVNEHMESHRESFPALPLTTKKKKKYTFGPPSTRHSKSIPVKSAWGK